MIVRISTEGQYAVEAVDELNELDNAAVVAVDSGEEDAFHEAYSKLLEFVRTKGKPLGADELTGSDLILPPPDVSLAEARSVFTADGLLPD